MSISHFSGTSKLESSAYLQIWLVAPSGYRSIMQIVNNVGPIPEPCTIAEEFVTIYIKQTNRHADEQTDRQKDRQSDIQTYRYTYKQTDRQINIQTNRETGIHTYRQTDR